VVSPGLPAAAAGVSAAVMPQAFATEQLLLQGPAGADFDAVNRLLRERLPTGYTLRVLATSPEPTT
jgi:hypothetical protein